MPDQPANLDDMMPVPILDSLTVGEDQVKELRWKKLPFGGEQRIRLGDPIYTELNPTNGKVTQRNDNEVIAHYISETFGIPYASVKQMSGGDFSRATAAILQFFL